MGAVVEVETTGSFFLTASLCTAARAPSGTLTHRLEEVEEVGVEVEAVVEVERWSHRRKGPSHSTPGSG